jgi:DGQHR domain-containing protein
MPNIPPPRATVAATPEFPFIAGRYSDSRSPVSYFVTVMRYRQAASNLRLVSELPGNSSLDWNIEELYQREIDWARVKRGLVPYLRQLDSPHFFNAVTVALLPQTGGRLVSMSGGNWHPPPLADPARFQQGCVRSFGPITCGYWGTWETPDDDGARLGCISWNIDEIAAVAIDGQHRLAALKKLPDINSAKSTIPVILVVSHPDLGAQEGHQVSGSLALTRRLFIDLNRHSVKVSRARQILLDDRDPVSLCTRALVGERLANGEAELAACRLPLSLVDWHSEQAKFDKGPYISTILGIDWVVERCMELPATFDTMAYGVIEAFITRSADTIGVPLTDASARLEQAQRNEAPFEFSSDGPASDLEQIKVGFEGAWSPALIHVLTELSPYKALRNMRQTDGSLRPEFAGWWSAKSRRESDRPGPAGDAFQAVIAELQHRGEPACSPLEFERYLQSYEEAKKDREIAFAVVFQRALFLAFFSFLRARLALSEESPGDPFGPGEDAGGEQLSRAQRIGRDRLEAAKFLVRVLNHLADGLPDLYLRTATIGSRPQRRIWAGSLYSEENESIDFTAAASERASDLLLAIVLIGYIVREDPTARANFSKIWRGIEDPDSPVYRKLAQAVGRMAKSGIGMRIAKPKAQPGVTEEEVESLATKEVRERLEALSKHLRNFN